MRQASSLGGQSRLASSTEGRDIQHAACGSTERRAMAELTTTNGEVSDFDPAAVTAAPTWAPTPAQLSPASMA